jgi:hypothetical protein
VCIPVTFTCLLVMAMIWLRPWTSCMSLSQRHTLEKAVVDHLDMMAAQVRVPTIAMQPPHALCFKYFE